MFYIAYILDTIKGLSYYACSYFKPQLKGFWRNAPPGY
jgi:hypothetical protein